MFFLWRQLFVFEAIFDHAHVQFIPCHDRRVLLHFIMINLHNIKRNFNMASTGNIPII